MTNMNQSTPIWLGIANEIRRSISEGQYVEGQKLPTESAYAKRFGVNRHTVRHAMTHLVQEGLVHSRRGAGYFVIAKPLEYPVGNRTRFHKNLLAAGHTPSRKILSIESRKATQEDFARLKIKDPDLICVCHALSFSNAAPLSFSESHFPTTRLGGIEKYLKNEGSITSALKKCGVHDYVRSSTRITAVTADAMQALHLQLRQGAPLLYVTSINVDTNGMPVEYGQTWFASERVTLSLDHS